MVALSIRSRYPALVLDSVRGLRPPMLRIATRSVGTVSRRARINGRELTLYAGGRAIINGTDDGNKARTLCPKYVGA